MIWRSRSFENLDQLAKIGVQLALNQQRKTGIQSEFFGGEQAGQQFRDHVKIIARVFVHQVGAALNMRWVASSQLQHQLASFADVQVKRSDRPTGRRPKGGDFVR